MKTLIRNVSALLASSERVVSGVDIALDGNTILALAIGGVNEHAPGFVADDTIDGSDQLALPGFFNAHTHAAMTLERGWAEDLPFDRWLNEKIWVAESVLQREDVYWGAMVAIAEMIRCGIVGFADHYFYMDQVARAVEETGVKALLAWCHFGIGDDFEVGKVDFEGTVAFARHWQGSAGGRIRTVLGPHSPYMVPPEVLRRFAAEAHRLGSGVHLHLSESSEQVKNSLAKHGKTPAEHVRSLGLFDLPRPLLAAHCNIVTDEDLALLSSGKVWVAHTPKTYQKLAMEMPHLERFLQGGVRVALGTDGPASNSDLNMFEVMRLTGLAQKNLRRDPTSLPRYELLKMASQCSAHALGFLDSGVLEAGARADLVLVDTRAAHFIPRHDLAAAIVYTAHPSDVSHVWCDGKLLFRKGEYLTLDLERIRWEAESRAFRMVGKPMELARAYDG